MNERGFVMSYCYTCGKELLLRQYAILVDGVPELFCPKCFEYFANHPEEEPFLYRLRDLRAAGHTERGVC